MLIDPNDRRVFAGFSGVQQLLRYSLESAIAGFSYFAMMLRIPSAVILIYSDLV